LGVITRFVIVQERSRCAKRRFAGEIVLPSIIEAKYCRRC